MFTGLRVEVCREQALGLGDGEIAKGVVPSDSGAEH